MSASEDISVSWCCRAPAKSKTNWKPGSTGLEDVGTYYVCEKCGKACDVFWVPQGHLAERTPMKPPFDTFKETPTTFKGCGANCERYAGGECFFEVRDDLKTQKNWELDLTEPVFIPREAFLPLAQMTQTHLGQIHIIGHVEGFWITLDPRGAWPVLHPKTTL